MRYALEKRDLLFVVKAGLIIFSLLCTFIVALSDTVEHGLEGLFLLPLSFFLISVLIPRHVIAYALDSFGLLILYALMVLRYLVSPVLISLSGTLVSNLCHSPASLWYAVIIMVIELVTVTASVLICWKPIQDNSLAKNSRHEFKLSWLGAATMLFLMAILLYRGTLPNVIEHLSFGSRYSFAYSPLKTYDMSAALTIKAFVFLIIVAWAAKKWQNATTRPRRLAFLLLAILAGILNSVIYEASNRTTMVMCAMASLAVLLHCFGRTIRRFLPIIAVIGFVFVWSLFAYGTLGARPGENLLDRQGFLSDLSRVAELYSNGVSTEAHAYEVYDAVVSQVSIETYFSEIIKSNNIFTLPGLWVVERVVDSIPSFQALFNQTLEGQAYILPNSGLAMYSGSLFLGILLDILFHYWIVAGIYFFYKKKYNSADVGNVYIFTYCEMICGFVLMNNIMIAFGLLTAIPFLLFIMTKLNAWGHRIK